MNVKLLKQIRKRYTITKIEKLASNANGIYRTAKYTYGLPFFVLTDNNSDIRIEFSNNISGAKEKLHDWILSDYSEMFRHKDEESSKVWWVKP